MPNLKFVVRKDVVNADGKANIKLRISHRGKVAHIGTQWYIDPKYMGSDGWITSRYEGEVALNGSLIAEMKGYNDAIFKLGTNLRYMDVNALARKLKGCAETGQDFFAYMHRRIALLRKEGRAALADLYEVTLQHLEHMTKAPALPFDEISVSFLERFESYLKLRGSSRNTIRNYMCNIRAVFNHAIDNDAASQELFPFRKYRIAQERKQPRALDVTEIRRLIRAREYLTRAQQRAVDIFLLILYTGGTNLKDLLFLRKEDIYKDRMFYKRYKTGREYSIRIFPEAREIIDQYKGKILALYFMEQKERITPASRKGQEHKDLLHNMNVRLAIAGIECGIPLKLTTYVARYSFATIASRCGIQKDTIAHILGHGENTMTDLYIDFDEATADAAIRKVIDAVTL